MGPPTCYMMWLCDILWHCDCHITTISTFIWLSCDDFVRWPYAWHNATVIWPSWCHVMSCDVMWLSCDCHVTVCPHRCRHFNSTWATLDNTLFNSFLIRWTHSVSKTTQKCNHSNHSAESSFTHKREYVRISFSRLFIQHWLYIIVTTIVLLH